MTNNDQTTNIPSAQTRANNPYNGSAFRRNIADMLRRDAYKITDDYGIPRDQALLLIAECGNIEAIAAGPQAEYQVWRDKVQQKCINYHTECNPVPKSKPVIRGKVAVPNDSMMFQEAQAKHYVPDARYLNLKGQVDQRVGKHAGIGERRAAWLQICKENEETKPTVRDEFNMQAKKNEKQTEMFENKPEGKPATWTTAESDAYEVGVVEICKEHNIPSNLMSKFTHDILKDTRENLKKMGKKPADLLSVLASYAMPWAHENVPVQPDPDNNPTGYDPDGEPPAEFEKMLEGLSDASQKLTEVVPQNAPLSNGEAATNSETTPPSAIEPEIANQAPTNAPEAENVIEGEIAEDKKPEPTADEMIVKLRTEADKLIIATWPDLHSKDRITERVAHLETAWKGCKGTHEAYAKYGYDVALKMVHDYCVEKMLQPSALAKVAEQPMNITPITNAPSTRNFKMPTPEEFQMMQVFARSVAASKLYKDIDTFDKAFVILWKGFELGVGLGAALDGIYIINGRPWPGAQILKAVVMASGLAERFDVICDDYKAVATVKRKGMDLHTYTFTKDDAIAAGLWNNEKTAWPKHPKRMMMHRVSRMAVVTDFPDLAAGIGIDPDGAEDELPELMDVAEQKAIAA